MQDDKGGDYPRFFFLASEQQAQYSVGMQFIRLFTAVLLACFACSVSEGKVLSRSTQKRLIQKEKQQKAEAAAAVKKKLETTRTGSMRDFLAAWEKGESPGLILTGHLLYFVRPATGFLYKDDCEAYLRFLFQDIAAANEYAKATVKKGRAVEITAGASATVTDDDWNEKHPVFTAFYTGSNAYGGSSKSEKQLKKAEKANEVACAEAEKKRICCEIQTTSGDDIWVPSIVLIKECDIKNAEPLPAAEEAPKKKQAPRD